ncbi:tRNA (guanosine(37)-N1)-methyltransferase TrmD [Candidatus Peregrinibacteria bacterium CG11_big_fil_rev_8_21_14_0_20_46_8]|nr:MAG: tRNA (guanosine(37)-N1)-methyltransferase TrmD [Candidatus Peregrinibacteria bacterium CG11_big_fil_rev_8_21_14_0_20_46_8]
MTFDILTIFPNLVTPYFEDSILKREILKKTIRVRVHDIRKYSKNKHGKVDDIPYGGGAGMVMTPQPIYDCIQKVRRLAPAIGKSATPAMRPVIYLSPHGKKLDYALAKKLSKKKGLILLCGRYEGIDERLRKLCIDEEISIGDFVLTGGELPALTVVDAVTRLLPGALGDERSAHEDSFTEKLDGKKEYPHYTRPPEFKGLTVPEVLRSGDHAKINAWRKKNLK